VILQGLADSAASIADEGDVSFLKPHTRTTSGSKAQTPIKTTMMVALSKITSKRCLVARIAAAATTSSF
jgi:hypothetical protein